VLANALADDTEDGDLARERMAEDPPLHAPHLVDLEVLSVLRRRVPAGAVDQRRAALAIQDLQDLPMTRYPQLPFVRRIWELRQNLTPYDAAYVALAEALECAVLTADARLGRVSDLRCPVEVLRR